MKNYHAVSIALLAIGIAVLAATSVYAKTVDTTHTERPAVCPLATEANTGWVAEDTNGDGFTDHAWRVYSTGVCQGMPVDTTDSADIVLEVKP